MMRRVMMVVSLLLLVTTFVAWCSVWGGGRHVIWRTAVDTVWRTDWNVRSVSVAQLKEVPPTTPREPVSRRRFAGFEYTRIMFYSNLGEGPPSMRARGVRFPTWFPIVLFSAWPIVELVRFVRRRRNCEGCCRHCGYDLTKNETGVCPECGEAVA